MKNYNKARKMAVVLLGVLLVDSFSGEFSPYINSYAYTEKPATVNATTLNVRSGPGTTYSIVTKLANGAGVTVIDEKNASDGALWYEIRFGNAAGQTVTGYVSKSFLRFPASYTNDGSFEAQIAAEGFPESYKLKLRQLHAQYPNWIFKAQHTNLDWNTAVKEESQVGRTLVHTNSMSSWKSMADGAYNWDTSSWVGYDGSSWVTASEDIVKYYMDPRNFLDETNIFQFLSHTYNSGSHTMEGLSTMIKGTFLGGQAAGGGSSPLGGKENPPQGTGGSSYGPGGAVGPGAALSPSGGGSPDGSAPSSNSGEVSLEGPPQASVIPKNPPVLMEYGPGANLPGPSASDESGGAVTPTGSSSYAEILMNAATQSGVNPYVLAAMIIQEQGSSGTGKSISGTQAGYEGYYNFFNIEAYQSGSMDAVSRGLWWASQSGSYERPWNSPEKSILGGALYYGNNYVKVGQDTFYLKKFNVQGSNLYKHQYMTNVQGAASEGAVYAKAYNNEMKGTALEFKIPVYNNMPDNACSQPTGDGNSNNKLAGLSVEGFVMTPTFNRDILEYNLIVDPSVSSVNISASVLNTASSVSGAGMVTIQNGNNDIKVTVTAQNGNVREYILHVVRQANGPTYSSSVNNGGGLTAPGSSGSASSGDSSGSGGGPGVSNPSAGTETKTPGGSTITIAPDGSSGMSAQSSGGVMLQAPGLSVTVPGQTQTAQGAGNQVQGQTSHGAGNQGQTQTQTAQGAGNQVQGQTSHGAGNQGQTQTAQGAGNQVQGQTSQTTGNPVQNQNAAQNGVQGQTSGTAGDINGDGKVNSQDVLKVQRHLLGFETLPAQRQPFADLNGDGKINAQDLLLLQKKVLGL